jgi:hypothetical protein
MILIITLFVIDLLIKLVFNKLIFLSLIISLLLFYSNKTIFTYFYFFSSLINDWLLILPLGFTAFYWGLILIVNYLIKKFFLIDNDWLVNLLIIFSLGAFILILWFFYFKMPITIYFFEILLINAFLALLVNFLYKNL